MPDADPVSVIRVRVAGVTGTDALSRERINAVAQQIAQRTGLDVDIAAGSSPSPVTIDLPAGTYGPPPLTLTEGWVKKGVAVAILSAVDKTSVALFTLILVVCVLFVGNAATAAVRGLAPAWLAARADPVSSVRPPVLAVRRARQPRGITSLLRRLPAAHLLAEE